MGDPLFVVDSGVFERFPAYIVGCVYISGVDNGAAVRAIDTMLLETEQQVSEQYADADLKLVPGIAVWRAAFSACGWSPSKYPTSIEALVKRVARGQTLPRFRPIVDLVNAVSLTTMTPIGAHDACSLAHGPLTVRVTKQGDVFQPMGEAPTESPDDNEIVYASGGSVRTRRWVWRQSRDALIQATTRDVFFPIDGFRPDTEASVLRAIDLLTTMGKDALTAKVQHGVVYASNRQFNVKR